MIANIIANEGFMVLRKLSTHFEFQLYKSNASFI